MPGRGPWAKLGAMTVAALNPRQRRRLCAKAHALDPVVQLGKGGLTDGVVQALESALLAHELIKVQMRRPEDKKAQAEALAEATGACLCGVIGHVAILYRPHPETPRVALE